MKEKGFSRDAEQCKAKIKNLKTEYRQVKDNNNKTMMKLEEGEKHLNTMMSWMQFLAIDQHPDHQWFWMPQREGSLLSPVRRERETALTTTAVRQ